MTSRSPARRPRVRTNGPAIRVIRELLGGSIEELAGAMGVDRSYVSNLELGHRDACSPVRFARLVQYLRLTDRRAVMADPYGEAEIDRARPAGDPPTGPIARVSAEAVGA